MFGRMARTRFLEGLGRGVGRRKKIFHVMSHIPREGEGGTSGRRRWGWNPEPRDGEEEDKKERLGQMPCRESEEHGEGG